MAVSALPVRRLTGTGNDTGDSISGRTYHWFKTKSPQTPWSPANRPAGGRYFRENETWYGITGVKPNTPAAGGRHGRILDWHDFPISGYSWGYVAPMAVDCNAGPSSKIVREYLGYAPVCSGYTADGVAPHTVAIPLVYDDWNWLYWRIIWSRSCSVGHTLAYLVNSTTPLGNSPVIDAFGRTLNTNLSVYPGVDFFQGLYVASGYTGPQISIDIADDRWGQSWQAAYDDVPSYVEDWGSPLSTYQTLATTIDPAAVGIPTAIAADIDTGGADPEPPPVTELDPVVSVYFGNPRAETQNNGLTSANNKAVAAFQADVTIDLDSVFVSCAGGGGTATSLRGVLYAMSGSPADGGVPTTLLGQTASATVDATAEKAWVQCSFAAPVRVTAGTWYAVGYHTSGGQLRVHWANAGGWFFYQASDAFSDGASSPFGTVNAQDTRRVAVYATGVAARRATGTRTGSRGGGTRRVGEGGGGG